MMHYIIRCITFRSETIASSLKKYSEGCLSLLIVFMFCFIRPASGNKPVEYGTFLQTRPEQMENEAIEMVIRLCKEYRYSVPQYLY